MPPIICSISTVAADVRSASLRTSSGDDRKPRPARRRAPLDRGVEREQVGLAGNFPDHAGDRRDLIGALRQFADALRGLSDRVAILLISPVAVSTCCSPVAASLAAASKRARYRSQCLDVVDADRHFLDRGGHRRRCVRLVLRCGCNLRWQRY